MRSFFDPALIEKSGSAFIREHKVDESLLRLIPKARITKGHFAYPGRSEPRDLVWNHMDQNHRPLIHRTYGDAMRIFIGKDAAFSLTRFGNLPVMIPVFDGYYKDNGFYQVMCLFGVVVVVITIECNTTARGTQMDVDWAIASHKWLSFLHRPLDRRLKRLNELQNAEDVQIRDRRIELRAKGYRFATDEPDFINSNAMANNVIYPSLAAARSIALSELPEGRPHRVDIGDRAYILRRVGRQVEAWPGVCPHEGAVLAPGDLRGNAVKCPWHGLEFGARRIDSGGAELSMCGARLVIVDDRLDIMPARTSAADA